MRVVTIALLTALVATLVDAQSTTLRDLCYYDIGMLIDTSGSITQYPPGRQNWKQLKVFLNNFVQRIRTKYPDVRLALVSFWQQAEIEWHFDKSTDIAYMKNKIKLMREGGGTVMDKAFRKMRDEVLRHRSNRRKVPDLVIFMTDGFPNPLTADPRPIATQIKNSGINILGLGITRRVNDSMMREVSSPNYYLPVKSYTELARRVDNIVKSACTEPPKPPPKRCYYDVGLLIDSSSSITEIPNGGTQNWIALQSFLKDFVKQMRDRYPEVRLAMNTFSNYNRIRWLWHDSTNVAKMQRIIDGMRAPQGGNTYMDKAFRKMKNDVFGDSGNRKNVPDMMIFMTDGKPNPVTEDPRQIATEMKNSGVQILGLGITDRVDDNLMRDVVSPGAYLPLKNYAALTAEVQRIIGLGCRKAQSG